MEEKNASKSQLVMVVGFLVFYLIFKAEWLAWLSATLGIIFLAIPTLGKWILKGWFKLAEGLGWLNSRILLSAIFYVILLPIATLQRFSGKDNLKLRYSKEDSAYDTRNHQYGAKDLENTW